MVRLLVVEDHALVREGLVQTLRQLEPDVEVRDVPDFEGACVLLEQHRFDLLVLDLGLPGLDGLSCLRTFKQRYPVMPVVILSAYDDAHTISKAMKSGAAGFVSKAYSSEQLLAVLREVIAGRICEPVPSSAVPSANFPRQPIGGDVDPADLGLTERQAEVLGLMATGKSNRDIAALLGLTEGTVKIHLTSIFKLLGVSSRTQAMVVVAQKGLRL